jgi:hypothetical protein
MGTYGAGSTKTAGENCVLTWKKEKLQFVEIQKPILITYISPLVQRNLLFDQS